MKTTVPRCGVCGKTIFDSNIETVELSDGTIESYCADYDGQTMCCAEKLKRNELPGETRRIDGILGREFRLKFVTVRPHVRILQAWESAGRVLDRSTR